MTRWEAPFRFVDGQRRGPRGSGCRSIFFEKAAPTLAGDHLRDGVAEDGARRLVLGGRAACSRQGGLGRLVLVPAPAGGSVRLREHHRGRRRDGRLLGLGHQRLGGGPLRGPDTRLADIRVRQWGGRAGPCAWGRARLEGEQASARKAAEGGPWSGDGRNGFGDGTGGHGQGAGRRAALGVAFFGTVGLGPLGVGRDMSVVSDQVVKHLSTLWGAAGVNLGGSGRLIR